MLDLRTNSSIPCFVRPYKILPPPPPLPRLLPAGRVRCTSSAEVARRLEFVSPSVVRASVVLFSVTYSYSVAAYALFCATPMGQESIDGVKDDSMVQRRVSRSRSGKGRIFQEVSAPARPVLCACLTKLSSRGS